MAETTKIGLVSLEDSDLLLAQPEDDVRGLTVVDPHHHRVGEVDDLIIDADERRARALVVSSGGLMGLGVTKRLIPANSVTRVDEHVHIQQSHRQVHEAGSNPALDLTPAYREVCAHYGYAPFWAPGYSHPNLLGRPTGTRTP